MTDHTRRAFLTGLTATLATAAAPENALAAPKKASTPVESVLAALKRKDFPAAVKAASADPHSDTKPRSSISALVLLVDKIEQQGSYEDITNIVKEPRRIETRPEEFAGHLLNKAQTRFVAMQKGNLISTVNFALATYASLKDSVGFFLGMDALEKGRNQGNKVKDFQTDLGIIPIDYINTMLETRLAALSKAYPAPAQRGPGQ